MGIMRYRVTIAAWLVTLLIAGPAGAAELRDPWYSDIDDHWAKRYISTMWQEDTLDGYIGLRSTLFYPDRRVTRAEFTVMTAKTFRLEPIERSPPTFADVPASYRFFSQKRAHPYVEAAFNNGIVRGNGNGLFFPDSLLTREEAITVIIRSLGLESYARSLPQETINYYLNWFADSWTATDGARPYLAAAISIRLLQGYGNGTIRPRGLLSRAETATVLYRSCLVSAIAHPNPFSPDFDGFEDETVFRINTLKNQAINRWKLEITNWYGDRVFADLNPGLFGSPPQRLSWDGRGKNGQPLPFGRYFYRIRVWDYQDNLFVSPILPIYLEKKTISASVVPAQAQPGSAVTLWAATTGQAKSVRAIITGGRTIELVPLAPPVPGDPNATRPWSARHEIESSALEGDYQAVFRAEYAAGTRTTAVPFSIRRPLRLSGQIVPNPVPAGSPVTISAGGSENLSSVMAELPWGALALNRSAPGSWSAASTVPVETAPGSYPVTLVGRSGQRRVEHRLTLEVTGNPLDSVLFILTD